MDALNALVVPVKFRFIGYVAKTNVPVPRKFLKEKHFVILSQHFDEDCFERALKFLFAFIHLSRGVLVKLVAHEKVCLSRNIW